MKRMTYHGIQNGRERVLHVSRETFLRVRVWFVECRDALMQILVSLDRDKNSSIGVAAVLLLWRKESEERLMVRLGFLRRLPIELASEERLTIALVLFFIRWLIRLASERDRQTLLVHPRFQFGTRKKQAFKKIFFCISIKCFIYNIHTRSIDKNTQMCPQSWHPIIKAFLRCS